MFRTIRPLVASAVFTVTTLALSATALAMPSAPDPDPLAIAPVSDLATPLSVLGQPIPHGAGSAAVAQATHSASATVNTWVVVALVVLGITAAVTLVASRRTHYAPRIARG